jgi:hypothetical protein
MKHWKNRISQHRYGVYTFRVNQEIIYVGETGGGLYRCLEGLRQPSSTRVYKWRNDSEIKNAELELMFERPFQSPYHNPIKKFRQVVEADVALHIRNVKGSWPRKLKQLTILGNEKRRQTIRSSVDDYIRKLRNSQWI